jgi:hypothetical protein
MTENGEESKIHVDEDWKAEMQAEKEKLAEDSKQDEEAQQQGGEGQLPPASFTAFVNSLMMQTLMAMGGVEDPETKKRVVDLNLARFHIDMLGVLEEKTKGNLTEEETQLLGQALHELRMNFLGFAKMVNESQSEQANTDQQPSEE